MRAGISFWHLCATVTREQYFCPERKAQQQRLNGYAAWCVVIYEGQQLGWVNRRFLTEDGE